MHALSIAIIIFVIITVIPRHQVFPIKTLKLIR